MFSWASFVPNQETMALLRTPLSANDGYEQSALEEYIKAGYQTNWVAPVSLIVGI